MFTWIPIYKELAKALLPFKAKQTELINMLRELHDTGVPTIALEDQGAGGKKQPLAEIDPFTLFASFNRNMTDANRIAHLRYFSKKLGLTSPLPGDFKGVPIANAMKAWFFPWAASRGNDDISNLWALAETVISAEPGKVPDALFDACLEIQQVAVPKLTMGMFWLNPTLYLSLDVVMRDYLTRKGLAVNVADSQSYKTLLQAVKTRFGADFAALSHAAWLEANAETPHYWAGGSTWGDESKADEFIAGNFWEIGWEKDEDDPAAKRTWKLFEDVKVGDEFAIKGLGGRYDLRVYYIGKIIEKSEDGTLKLQKLDRPLFRGKGPKGTNWFGTLLQVTDQSAIDTVFLGHAPALAAPFNQYFMSLEEAEWAFALLQQILTGLGVKDQNDPRVALTLPKGDKFIRLNFCQWVIASFFSLDQAPDRAEIALLSDVTDLPKKGTFTNKNGEPEAGVFGVPIEQLRAMEPELRAGLDKSLAFIASRFGEHERTPYRNAHQPQLMEMVFDPALRTERLLAGLTPAPEPAASLPPALNTILYGPPGTGKTYKLRTHYMKMFTDSAAAPTDEERASVLVKELSWWEVVALALLSEPDNEVTVPEILQHPLVQARLNFSSNKHPSQVIWGVLQAHTKKDCPNVNYSARTDPLIFSKSPDSVWSIDAKLADTEVPHLRKILEAYLNPQKPPAVRRYEFTTFHQSFSYEDFVEGIKPQTDDAQGRDDGHLSYEVRFGVFREICRQAEANPTKNYAVFIDEINRGNVASIFGELITAIEEDKRLGETNELKITLPYSRELFGVPANLYIIGTMNTADRSVEALDTALRRRFTFEEMRPDASLITQPEGLDVDLQKLFLTINARIEQLLDHDHCIGHYYFMDIQDLAGLQSTFANKILPLLREYFYGNPAKVGMVLGAPFVSHKAAKTAFAPGPWGADDLDEKEVFHFADPTALTEKDFQAIYAENNPSI
jgi:AAA domain (dynein-related subfamily)